MDSAHPPSFRPALLALLPALRGYARALTRDATAADDLVQETVLRALANAAQWEEGPGGPDTAEPLTGLRPWLFTILRNTWLDGLRRAARDRRMPGPEERVSVEAQSGAMAIGDLAAAMALLPLAQREALILVAGQGLTVTAAAAVCGVAEGTIRARLSRGRRSLRQSLGDP